MVLSAVALHRTVLIHQLELAARTDGKTGLLNATAWYEHAHAALDRTDRASSTMAILIIDLDHFKKINDGPGHLVGDAVLQQVAEVLKASVRRTDSIGRFGGDEFAVLLPETDTSEALAVAARIQHEVSKLVIQDDPQPGTGLAASIGVAVYPDVAETNLDGLMAAADDALNSAKNGRPRCAMRTSESVRR